MTLRIEYHCAQCEKVVVADIASIDYGQYDEHDDWTELQLWCKGRHRTVMSILQCVKRPEDLRDDPWADSVMRG
ncbi:MAG: hypothetical protein GY906_22640 [bacterium]|nr:hypothetical protein [bacterium]